MNNLFNSENCTISHQEEADYILVQWIGFPKSDKFREACLLLLNKMKEYQIKKLITDTSKAKIFAVTDQKWLNEHWLPLAEKAGYYCSAAVTGKDVFITTAVNSIAHKRDSAKFKHKKFETVEEAKNWLKTV